MSIFLVGLRLFVHVDFFACVDHTCVVFSNGMFSLFILLVLAIQIIAYEILLNIMVDLCFLALISNNLWCLVGTMKRYEV
jgi:hypothetical protein